MRRRLPLLVSAVSLGLLAPLGVLPTQAAPGDALDPDAKPDLEEEVVESQTGSYIVVMRADPLVVDIAQDDLNTPAAQAEGDAIEATHDQVLGEAGISTSEKVQDYTNALNGFSATLSHAQAVKLAANPKVATVLPDEMRQLTTDSSGEYIGLAVKGGAWDTGVTGEGVVVGVIDSGIWPEHPSFADDGTYGPPPVTLDNVTRPSCDFGNTAHNPNDAPFTCNNKLIGARQTIDTYRALIGAEDFEFDSARDDDGHGTHTASTAAGNAGVEASLFGKSYGEISGIAPRARIIAYKGLGTLGGFTSDLAASIDQAVADGVDVINYSIGGGASGNGPDDIAFLFAADAGVFVATSAGNSGDAPGTIGGPADVPWITTVAASTQKRFFQGTVVLRESGSPAGFLGKNLANGLASANNFDPGSGWWKREVRWWQRSKTERVKGASITPPTAGSAPLVDAEDAGNDLCLRGSIDPAVVTGAVVLCRRGAIGRAEKGLAVAEAGGVGMILYNNSDTDNLFTDTHFVPTVHVDYTEGLQVKQYIDDRVAPTAEIKNTGKKTRIDYDPSITIFSSRGPNPTSEDIIKPDITAPGLQILAGHSPMPEPGNVSGELFQAIAGTSMSSPHVAGLFALIKQVHPDWSAAQARSALMTTADPDVLDNDRMSFADPFDTGSGHVEPGKVARKGSAFNPGLTYDAGLFEYAAFTCGADLGIFTPGSCSFLDGLGIPSDASDLNYPSMAIAELAGSQTITRTVTSVADKTRTFGAFIIPPDGYDVVVEPAVFKIAPGESVTYEMTITNNGGGPIGEWRFGDLWWKSGGYKVHSPIAVRGTALNTPPVVFGTGTDGTATFDVSFGYSGAYTAAAHGLEAPTALAGEVGPDPDQTFGTADDDQGGVVLHDFSLSGAAFLRLALEIPGPDDIDLFLLDAAGNIVASSTAGGTDELIELAAPADGNYTLAVHGWQVTSPPLAYSVSQWVVSATPGGSLAIDSTPTAAVVGQVAPITVSWAGLGAGTEYLGAVSHSDANGVMALTLVQVAA